MLEGSCRESGIFGNCDMKSGLRDLMATVPTERLHGNWIWPGDVHSFADFALMAADARETAWQLDLAWGRPQFRRFRSRSSLI